MVQQGVSYSARSWLTPSFGTKLGALTLRKNKHPAQMMMRWKPSLRNSSLKHASDPKLLSLLLRNSEAGLLNDKDFYIQHRDYSQAGFLNDKHISTSHTVIF
uniref:Uncharacterized protein n=1 Tax=Cacopsylla melanoneura TaxID=428564 RepID=A0A8D8QVD0_9HEMI